MRILVFGAGALGQAVGCMLAAGGHRVDMVLRERHREVVKAQGLAVTGIFGDYRTEPGKIGVHTTVSSIREQEFDYALVTTKSYDTETAAQELLKLDRQEFTAVSMQNGCGNLEFLIERFGSGRTLASRVITGFEIERPGLVRITVSADDIHIGGYEEGAIPESALRLAEAIRTSGLPCIPFPLIRRDLFAKLLYNSALNPLGAALGVPYGVLGDNPDSRGIMNGIVGEVFEVIRAMGARTHWDTPEEYEKFFYREQLPATYHHRSSMLQDLETGKRTEIDALTGYVSIQGRAHGIETPICDTLSRIVRFLEAQGK
jgi:2-dehydropantoate 2-reductase